MPLSPLLLLLLLLLPLASSQLLYLPTNAGLQARRATDGQLVWNVSASFMVDISAPAMVDNRLYIATAVDIRALEPATGKQVWSWPTQMQQLLTVGGGIVYAVSGTSSGWFNGTSYFTALNASTGAMMWTKTIDSTVLVSLPVVLGDGSLIAAYFSYETLLFYISKFSARGDLLWSITITMSPGNRILQGRSNDIVPLYDGPFTSNRDGTRVFFALGDQISVVVNALDVTNGSILWTAGYQFGVAEESVFLAVGPQDDLYVADPGHLVAYDRDGNQKWAVPLSFLDDSVVQPVANWRDGNLYIACDCSRDGTLFAFDSNTGRLLWGVPLQGATFLNSLPTIDTAGNIFVASSTTLAAFRSSGELLWQQTNLGGAYLSGDIAAGCNCRPPFSYQRCLAACVLR